MRLRILISLSLLLFSWQKAAAQLAPADDFFHGGALFYLSNNIPAALERVTNGLALYPDDIKLKKLEELLKQQNQQQQQSQNQQQNNQSKPDQQKNQKQDQQPKEHNQKSDQEKQQDQQKKEAQEKKDQKQAGQPQAKKSEDKDKPKPGEEQQAQPDAAGQMTPQEAKQLLDSQKNDEMLMPVSRKDKASDQQKPVKDW
jgi:outer membrane biosynthesis protein TonB